MINARSLLSVLCAITIFGISAVGQQKDSTRIGKARGVIRDSIYNYVLPSASIAIYTSLDTGLVSYQLSNQAGEFHFENLPIRVQLMIRVFYTGYQILEKKFSVHAAADPVDLSALNLLRAVNELQEVVVTAAPPVRMNGDTLEFNASALKLDKNAVAEDLFRKLPGVNVWADGSITVNGKTVSTVLVDGKPFFGKDLRMATQNIPKIAIDKIQVYQQNRNINNPLDSTTQVNIKLKKGKNFGYFGKLSAGYAKGHHDIDANLNLFTSRTQLGIVLTGNNINKITRNAAALMLNSTYKKTGVVSDYQTDANLQGVNRFRVGGFVFQHDFIPDPGYYKKSILSGNGIYGEHNNNTTEITETVASVGPENVQIQKKHKINSFSDFFTSIDANYQKKNNDNLFYVKANALQNNRGYKNDASRSISDKLQNMLSTGVYEDAGILKQNIINLTTGITRVKSLYDETRRPGDWDITYAVELTQQRNNFSKKNTFMSVSNPAQNQSFDRQYLQLSDSVTHYVFASLGNISKWILGYRNFLNGVSLKIQNYAYVTTVSKSDIVNDMDQTTGSYVKNTRLSANNRLIIFEDKPTLQISKKISRFFGLRYNRQFILTLNIQQQLYSLSNSSDNNLQNTSYHYSKFTPGADFTYSNFQIGRFNDTYSLQIKTNYEYPTVTQLVPLVDSSDLYMIRQGNTNLVPARHAQLNFNFQHTGLRPKKSLGYNFQLSAGVFRNGFADSVITDSLGRSSNYAINAIGKKYVSISGAVSKPIIINQQNQLQLEFSPSMNIAANPNNINQTWNIIHSTTFMYNLSVHYSYKDKFVLFVKQSFFSYKSRQSVIQSVDFINRLQSSSINLLTNITNRFNFGTNFTYNNISSTVAPIRDFSIWNANASYRFLRGNNIEVSFLAFDLLHQNKGLINRGVGNTFTTGVVNMLQQYYMLKLAFYPRKFGK